MRLDHTHDGSAKSWLEAANVNDTPFPLQNLPFGVFRRAGTEEGFRCGVALGNQVIDLGVLADSGAIDGLAAEAARACAKPALNTLFGMGPVAWRALRHALFAAFQAQAGSLRVGTGIEILEKCLVAQSDVEYGMPAQIGDYTDFYTSIDHARNIVKLLRPNAEVSTNFH